MKKAIITAAIVGGELTKKVTPYLPVTVEEIVTEAQKCVEVGASILHLHVRDSRGQPTNDPKIFKTVIQKIRKTIHPAPILQVSTGGSVGDSFESRLKPLQAKPDMASLNAGSVNFGDSVFTNPRPFIEKLAAEIVKKKLKPEIEIYDLSHLEVAMALVKIGKIIAPPHFQFVLGVKGGLEATEENLTLLISRLPKKATWTVAGIGRHQFPLAGLALKYGGHVRVGLEDNIYLEKGILAKGSHELVEKAVALAKHCGRSSATITEAREILNLCPA